MKENERRIIVEQINKDIVMKESLPQKEVEMESLLKNDFVKRYIQLKRKISNAKNCFLSDSNERIRELRFVRAMIGTDLYSGVDKCSHGIWFYVNSIKCYADPRCEHDMYLPCDNEDDPDFEYNVYICLDCQKHFETENWREFESENFVLKNYDDKNISSYLANYYQLLCEMSVEEAEATIIRDFNVNLKKSKQKTLIKTIMI